MASSFTTALALFALVRTAVSQSAIAESYLKGQLRDERGCLDLQLNISATSKYLDTKKESEKEREEKKEKKGGTKERNIPKTHTNEKCM